MLIPMFIFGMMNDTVKYHHMSVSLRSLNGRSLSANALNVLLKMSLLCLHCVSHSRNANKYITLSVYIAMNY